MATNVYFPVVGGISTYVRDLAKGLEARGATVRIIAYPTSLSRLPPVLRRLTYPAFAIAVFAAALAMRMRGHRPVIASHSASFVLMANVLAGRLLGLKGIHVFHSPLTAPSRALNRWTPLADAIVYVSNATRELYRTHKVPEAANEHIIGGGIDTAAYARPDAVPGKEAHILNLLFVGRICEEKGVRELIDAVGQCEAEVKLRIVGNAQTSAQQDYLAAQKARVDADPALASRVGFVGPRHGADLIDEYHAADVFVLPSIWEEPAPMVIAEAQAAGLPVLAFATGGLAERIAEGRDGWLVPRGDTVALAGAIDRLAANRDLVRHAGRAAADKAAAEFDLATMAERFAKVASGL